MPATVLHTVKSMYAVTTPSDHKAVVLQVGQPESASDPPRSPFPLELLDSEAQRDALPAALQSYDNSSCGGLDWWEGVRGLLRATAYRWRRENPTSGDTELWALVPESSPAPSAEPSFLLGTC